MSTQRFPLIIIVLFFFKLHSIASLPEQCRRSYDVNSYNCSSLNLKTLPSDVLNENYTQIKLANNPFSCDCNISWFLDRIENNPASVERIVDRNSVKCATPKHLASRLIVELTKEDVCDPCRGDKLVNTCDPVREECVATNSSYECRCKSGFRKKSATAECEAFNSCSENNTCSVYAQCINEIGSYKCVCKLGFTGDGKHCEDKDECALGTDECHKDAVCINEVGTYRCHCKAGYEEKKKGRLCVKDDSSFLQKEKNLIMISLVVGSPVIVVIFLIMFFIRRKRKKEQRASQGFVLTDGDNFLDDPTQTIESQQLLSMDSFFDDPCPAVKGLPTSESAWSEWPDYDDSRDTDSD